MAVDDSVAALAQAGNDTDALTKAIASCSHLDSSPGDDRQKLRGANFFAVIGSEPSLIVPIARFAVRGKQTAHNWYIHAHTRNPFDVHVIFRHAYYT